MSNSNQHASGNEVSDGTNALMAKEQAKAEAEEQAKAEAEAKNEAEKLAKAEAEEMPVFPLRRCQFVANLFEAVEAEAKEQTKAEAKVDNTTDSE
jgi:hypothetical protein